MITLSHIYKNYGNTQVLKNVNLNIKKGEIYGLVGKNGAGKTTIFKIILGLTGFNGGKLSIENSKTKKELQEKKKKISFYR